MRIEYPEALAHLRRLCHASTQKAVAKEMGISPQYLNDLLFERRDLGQVHPNFLAKIGLQKQVTVEWHLVTK